MRSCNASCTRRYIYFPPNSTSKQGTACCIWDTGPLQRPWIPYIFLPQPQISSFSKSLTESRVTANWPNQSWGWDQVQRVFTNPSQIRYTSFVSRDLNTAWKWKCFNEYICKLRSYSFRKYTRRQTADFYAFVGNLIKCRECAQSTKINKMLEVEITAK